MQRSIQARANSELTPIYAAPEEFSGQSAKYPYDSWGYGLLLCWLDGDMKKIPKVTLLNVASLAASGATMSIVSTWVESIRKGSTEILC